MRTTTGVKRVEDVQIGDYLFNADDVPVLCTGVSPPASGQLKRILYRDFDSRVWKTFCCTPDHRMPLFSYGTSPSQTKETLTWFTRCDRRHGKKEAAELHIDLLSDAFYRDLIDGDDRPNHERVHQYVDTVLNQHYHRGHDEYSPYIDQYLTMVANEELGNDREFVRGAMHTAMDRYLRNIKISTHLNEDHDRIEQLFDVFDIGEQAFIDMNFPSSEPPTSPARQAPHQEEDSSFLDTSQLSLATVDDNRFAKIRASIDAVDCQCRGFRKIFRRFKSEEQATLAHEILTGEHFHLIDPMIVSDFDDFTMSISEYENLCKSNKEIKKAHMKLVRAPLTSTPSISGVRTRDLPLDPYFLGLWLGDGTAATGSISSSDREHAVWMQGYVDRLNSVKPPGARSVRLKQYIKRRAGDQVPQTDYFSNVDCYDLKISCVDRDIEAGDHYNPVTTGLRTLELWNDKSKGIPKIYMDADEDTRLAVIAGLIESDGCYVKSHNTYRFVQMTEGHKQIVYDLKDLALSCGISVTGVDISMVPRSRMYRNEDGPPIPHYVVYLGKGSVKFQHHLLIARKRMDRKRTYYTHDARTFTVNDFFDGEYRAIEVSGGEFQLENRLMVNNCHLVRVVLELIQSQALQYVLIGSSDSFPFSCIDSRIRSCALFYEFSCALMYQVLRTLLRVLLRTHVTALAHSCISSLALIYQLLDYTDTIVEYMSSRYCDSRS